MLPAALLLPLAPLLALFPSTPSMSTTHAAQAPAPSYAFDPPADGKFPVPRPSLSYWLQGVRADPLLDYRSEGGLPDQADVVIIGSGMSGSLVAYELLHSADPPKSVVILEARETCSGATGRNAGHCKPDTYKGFTKYARLFGEDMALAILRNEGETFRALVAFVEAHDVDCDLWQGDTLDVAMSKEVKKGQLATYEAYKAAGGETAHIKVITDAAEAVRVSRLKSAESVVAWPAGSLYPWKLVAHLLRASLAKGLNLQTFTRVESITAADKKGLWSVNTPRGSITTKKVVHATNAFAPTLLPLLQDELITASAFMSNKVVPPPSFSGSRALQHTYGVLMDGGSMYSINPRSNTDGVILFGGDNPNVKDLTQLFRDHPELEADDRLGGFTPVTQAVVDLAENEFIGWGKFEDMAAGEGLDYDWSGIIGMTKDSLPFVGRVPGLEGHFVSAGHNGHGMARIFTTSPALAKLILDPALSFADTGLPGAFELTQARVDGLRSKPRAKRGLVLGSVQAKL